MSQSLRITLVDQARQLNLKRGQRLCTNCIYCIATVNEPTSSETPENTPVYEAKTETPDKAIYETENETPDNTPVYEAESSYHQIALEAMVEDIEDISPLKKKKHTMNEKKRSSYGKRKSKQIGVAIKKNVAKALDISEEEFASADDKSCSNCDDFQKLLADLKNKVKAVPRHKEIKLLTLVPESWDRKNVCKEFNVCEHLVKRFRKLKREKGILTDPGPKKGKVISPDIINRVTGFYESDEFTRMCPGKKEYISV